MRPSEATEVMEAINLHFMWIDKLCSSFNHDHHHPNTNLAENQLHKSANDRILLILSMNLCLAWCAQKIRAIETKTATNVARGHRQNVRLGSSRSRKLYSQSRVASSAADHKLPKNTTVSKKRAWSVTSPAEWQLPAKPFLFFFCQKVFRIGSSRTNTARTKI